jgi:hypothetical protein
VNLKLTCQPDFTDITVNGGSSVGPYLETILTAQVPKSYNIKKAFVLHILGDGTVDPLFPLYNPLYNTTGKSCAATPTTPAPIPCADFSITKDYVLTIKIHTSGNGRMTY